MKMKTDDAERILKLLADSLESGKEFAIAEAPEVVQQLLLWKRWELSLTPVLFVVFAAITGTLALRYFRLSCPPNTGSSDELVYILGWPISAVACMCSTCCALCAMPAALQIWLAPKVFLLEYAAGLLR